MYPMKSREDLIAQQERLQSLHPQAEEMLMKLPGVVGVGIGLKETGSGLTDEAAFRVYVERKKAPADVPADQLIPGEILGVKTDVIELDKTELHADEAEYRPVKGGIQTGNGSGALGTVGCVAKRTADNATVILSNHHVMFALGKGVGDKMGQPDLSESCCCTCGEIGTIAAGSVGGLVDCAIATVKSGIGTIQEINTIGAIAGTTAAIFGETVRKVGRTTGLTTGTVTDINAPASSTEGNNFTNQIRISPIAGVPKFSDHGDSGSVIVNASNQVVGLLWGGATGNTLANNIANVLTAMGITIPAAGGGADPHDLIAAGPTPEQLLSHNQLLLRRLRRTLSQTEPGTVALNLILEFRFEVMHLIQQQRAVGVVWQRKQGPAFVAALFRSLKEPAYRIPREIEGVTVQALLMSMATVLDEHGSQPLRAAIRQHTLSILNATSSHDTIEMMLAELAGTTALAEDGQ